MESWDQQAGRVQGSAEQWVVVRPRILSGGWQPVGVEVGDHRHRTAAAAAAAAGDSVVVAVDAVAEVAAAEIAVGVPVDQLQSPCHIRRKVAVIAAVSAVVAANPANPQIGCEPLHEAAQSDGSPQAANRSEAVAGWCFGLADPAHWDVHTQVAVSCSPAQVEIRMKEPADCFEEDMDLLVVAEGAAADHIS